jgi:4-amino-4-deoxy-L-arabinose transferase-like glycosyltransferase
VRRLPVAARWVALVALLNALAWSLITPPFHVPDETGHVAYLQHLAETGTIPNTPDAAVFSAEQARTLEALAFPSVVGRPRDRTLFSTLQDRGLDEVEGAGLSRKSAGGTVESSNQPPLFYGMEALVYHASPSKDLVFRLWLMRVLSCVLSAATAVFAFLFLRELFAEPWTWTVGGLVVAFQPVFGFIGSGVTPDTLLFTASAALFFALARAFRRGLTPRTGLLIGAALAVGGLAKLNFLALVPGALLALALLLWRDRRGDARGGALRGAAIALAIPVVLAAIYVALNVTVWDRSAWGGGAELAAEVAAGKDASGGRAIGIRDQLSYTWQLYLPRLPFMNDQFEYFPPWATWFKGGVGLFGWLDTPFPSWVYWLAFGIAVPLVALAALGLWRRRDALRGRLPELAVYAVLVAGLLGSIGVLGLRYREETGNIFEQARYLLPFLALYGAFAVTAALGAGRRARTVGGLLVLLAAAHGLFAQLLVISRFYG